MTPRTSRTSIRIVKEPMMKGRQCLMLPENLDYPSYLNFPSHHLQGTNFLYHNTVMTSVAKANHNRYFLDSAWHGHFGWVDTAREDSLSLLHFLLPYYQLLSFLPCPSLSLDLEKQNVTNYTQHNHYHHHYYHNNYHTSQTIPPPSSCIVQLVCFCLLSCFPNTIVDCSPLIFQL